MPPFQGAIFDVHGVLVDSPHEKAWRESLRELMEGEWNDIRGQTTWSPGAFTPQVYQQEISGKPRMSGARAALEYFHVPDDHDARLAEYAQHKQEMVMRLIEAGDFTAYPDALRFIIAVKDAGIRVAAASSSRNAKLFLRKIRLDTFAREQGITSASLRPGLTLLGLLRCRRLGPGLRPRKAGSRDVPGGGHCSSGGRSSHSPGVPAHVLRRRQVDLPGGVAAAGNRGRHADYPLIGSPRAARPRALPLAARACSPDVYGPGNGRQFESSSPPLLRYHFPRDHGHVRLCGHIRLGDGDADGRSRFLGC